MNILFHIDDTSRWMVLMSSVKNTVKYGEETGEKIGIEIVANSDAVEFLLPEIAEKKKLEEDFKTLLAKGVKIVACKNALIAHGIEDEQLIPGIEVVRASMIELAEKQNEGYAYIRP